MRSRRSARAVWAALLLLAAGLVAAPAACAQAQGWQVVSSKDGLLVERRPTDGGLYEVRATARSPLTPAAIFDVIWRQSEHPQFVPYLKRLDVLRDAGDERWTYEQVTVPLVQDRDYTVHLQKRVEPAAQRYEVAFRAANEAGPPPNPGHVRITAIRGRWVIAPGPGGQGSTVHYEVFSDPGGSLPAWMVNRGQSEAVPKLVRAMLDRAREQAGRS